MSRVIEIRSPKYVSSWDPKVLWWHAHTGCHPVNTTRDSHSKLEKCKIVVCLWGGAPPVTPVNTYLGGGCKKWAIFLPSTVLPFWNLISGLNMILRGPLSPNISQGGEGVTETPIVSKGLSGLLAESLLSVGLLRFYVQRPFAAISVWNYHGQICGGLKSRVIFPLDNMQRQKARNYTL